METKCKFKLTKLFILLSRSLLKENNENFFLERNEIKAEKMRTHLIHFLYTKYSFRRKKHILYYYCELLENIILGNSVLTRTK